MRLALEIIDGNNKGKSFVLYDGLKIGKKIGHFNFDDNEMSDSHAIVVFDFKKSCNIKCLSGNNLRIGFEEVTNTTLIPGLIFHLGQTAFKVVGRIPKLSKLWKPDFMTWLENFSAQPVPAEFFFFLKPIRLTFIQGPQYEEVYTLGYGPRELGSNNLDLNIKDPFAPLKVANFFQIGDVLYIKNLCGDAATINKKTFDQHIIYSGDVLEVSSNTIELSILT